MLAVMLGQFWAGWTNTAVKMPPYKVYMLCLETVNLMTLRQVT